jgi:hypothetical protein
MRAQARLVGPCAATLCYKDAGAVLSRGVLLAAWISQAGGQMGPIAKLSRDTSLASTCRYVGNVAMGSDKPNRSGRSICLFKEQQ